MVSVGLIRKVEDRAVKTKANSGDEKISIRKTVKETREMKKKGRGEWAGRGIEQNKAI